MQGLLRHGLILASFGLLVGIVSCSPAPSPARNPLDALTPAQERDAFTGIARETLEASPYYYALIEHAAGNAWVAALGPAIQPGTVVSVHPFGKKEAFTSRRLERTFDVLWFARVRVLDDPGQNGNPVLTD